MSQLTLLARMEQVEQWLGVAAIRPLTEQDYERAHTTPTDWKRAFDGFTWGATYMARHSHRNLNKGRSVEGIAQAIPVPFLGLAMVAIPISTCFIQRLDQKRVRSEDATREDTIAFEFWNARQVAKKLARVDQVQMLKSVHGISRRDVVAWACICLSLSVKVFGDIHRSSDRIKNSRVIRSQMRKMVVSAIKLRELYG